MANIHDYNFCPACGQKLQGDETLCPFCGYRLLEQELKKEEGLEKSIVDNVGFPPNNNSVPLDIQNVFCPTCNTKINNDEKVCSFCGFRMDGLSFPEEKFLNKEKKIEVNEGDGIPPVAELHTEKKVINLHPEQKEIVNTLPTTDDAITVQGANQNGNQNMQPQSSYSGDVQKKKKTRLIIVIVGIVLILAIVLIALLQFAGKINISALNRVFPSSKTTQTVPVVNKNYYVCYASAIINSKANLILSNIFAQEQANNSPETAKAAFIHVISLRYPADYRSFTPVSCKRFDTSTAANTERERVKSVYIKKKYNIRFAELH